jgi:hypothetical protein
MAPAKLKQHLTKNCSHMSSKSTDYLEWLLEFQNKQSKAFVSIVIASEKALEASYLVAELNTQKTKCCNKMQDENLKMFHLQ